MQLDTSHWSGEGAFTQVLLDALQRLEDIVLVRVEDAPATRSEADYNFISNELFVAFATRDRQEASRLLGIVPVRKRVTEKTMTLDDLRGRLEEQEEVGAPDYADEGMLQYLRTERIIPPYQTRGYKLVELVRIYEAGTAPRRE